MRWRKVGKVFDPTLFRLPNNCKEFAQAPQVLIFEDFTRVYFSTREQEQNGAALSHICYADFTKDFKNIIRVSEKTVIPLGKLGCFDEHGIFPLNVIKVGDEIWAFISGINRRKSVPVDSAIGVAISKDNGETFERIGDGPILGCSLHEPFLICDPFVQVVNDEFHMLYVYGKKWFKSSKTGNVERVYKIGHATSRDGLKWKRTGRQLLDDSISGNECQALPTFVLIDGVYHMYFCFRDSESFRTERSGAYRLGYATSVDLINWKRDDSKAGLDRSNDGWDCQMMCYPHIFKSEGRVYLLYNGNDFGRAGFGLAELMDID